MYSSLSVSLETIPPNWSEAIPRLGLCHNHPHLCSTCAFHPSGGSLQTDLLWAQEVLCSHWTKPPMQQRLWGWNTGTGHAESLGNVSSTNATVLPNRNWLCDVYPFLWIFPLKSLESCHIITHFIRIRIFYSFLMFTIFLGIIRTWPDIWNSHLFPQ